MLMSRGCSAAVALPLKMDMGLQEMEPLVTLPTLLQLKVLFLAAPLQECKHCLYPPLPAQTLMGMQAV